MMNILADSNAESPCLYFISLMGAPVEIVHGETSVTELLERCESAWSKHSKVAQSQKAPAPTSTPATTSQAPTTSQVETAGAASSSTSAAPANTGQGDTAALIQSLQSDTDADGTPLTLDQKIERARQLAAARAKLKMEEEAEVPEICIIFLKSHFMKLVCYNDFFLEHTGSTET